jgi:hypothetical protein
MHLRSILATKLLVRGLAAPATITLSSPNIKAKRKSGAPATTPARGTRTSPRTSHNPYATTRASDQPKSALWATNWSSSGGVAKGSGENIPEEHAARALSFASPHSKKVFMLSNNLPSTSMSAESTHPAVAESSRPNKKFKKGKDGDDANSQDGTYDNEKDVVPITNKATDNTAGATDFIDEDMRLCHRKAFMKKAFPERNQVHSNAQVQSGSIKSCRPTAKVDYIIYVISNWEKGIQVKNMFPGPDRDRLIAFR